MSYHQFGHFNSNLNNNVSTKIMSMSRDGFVHFRPIFPARRTLSVLRPISFAVDLKKIFRRSYFTVRRPSPCKDGSPHPEAPDPVLDQLRTAFKVDIRVCIQF